MSFVGVLMCYADLRVGVCQLNPQCSKCRLSLFLFFLETGDSILYFSNSPKDVFAIRILHRVDPVQSVRVTRSGSIKSVTEWMAMMRHRYDSLIVVSNSVPSCINSLLAALTRQLFPAPRR
jgi:hypothetical protein